MIVTKARRQGASAGCPRGGYRSAKWAFVYTVPRVSRICMYRFPLGKAAWAISEVRSGTVKVDGSGKLIGVPQRRFWVGLYGIALRNEVIRIRQQHHSNVPTTT